MRGVTERTFRRWSGRYDAEGADGVAGSAVSGRLQPVPCPWMRRSAW